MAGGTPPAGDLHPSIGRLSREMQIAQNLAGNVFSPAALSRPVWYSGG